MAYWWVNQGRTFRQERQGGYLWAPRRNKAGHAVHHWSTMTQIRPGDVIFCYVKKRIMAVAIASSAATDSPRPPELGLHDKWRNEGWRVAANYQPLREPVKIPPLFADLRTLLPDRYSPLASTGRGNDGYLYALPPSAARFLAEHIDASSAPKFDELIEAGLVADAPSSEASTERQAIVQSRVGQGRFRQRLLEMWADKCCVTGLALLKLLRASHIKPWSDSSNSERLDAYNGLLLSPVYDAAFDKGLISFDNYGTIVVSKIVDAHQFKLLGISLRARIRGLQPQHSPYLEYHREIYNL